MRFFFSVLLVLSVFHAQLFAQTPGCYINYINPANGSKITSTTTTDLIWQNISGTSYYDVYLGSQGALGLMAKVQQGANGISTYTATNLQGSTTYQWYVIPRTANGDFVQSCFGIITIFTTADSPVPPACTFYSEPQNGTTLISQTDVQLRWAVAPIATSYDIYFWTGDIAPTKPVTTAAAGASTYNVTGLLAGTTYHWYVVPKNAAGAATNCVYTQVSFTTAYAAPVNDNCSGAIEVIPGAANACGTTIVTTTLGATGSGVPACTGIAEDDVWFKFTPTSKRNKIALAVFAKIDPVIELFSGNCASLTSMGCYTTTDAPYITVQNMAIEFPALVPGQTYYYRVYGADANSVRTKINTCMTSVPDAPSNDECSGALLLTANADTSSTYSYTGVTGYASQSMVSCVAPNYLASDIWFKFVATATSQKISVAPNPYAGYDFAFQVFSGTCANFGSLACINNGGYFQTDSVVLNNLVVGNTYYMRVWDYHGDGAPQASFKIVINGLQPALTVPACSVNNTPANGAVLASSATSQLTWAAAVNATSYDVYLWTGSVATPTPIATVTETSYNATGLAPATTYYWYVVPKNATGVATGCAAGQFSFTIAALPIGPATGTGLQGTYYNGTALSGAPLLTRTDTSINFELTYSKQPLQLSPAPGIVPEDLFSVRWTGQIQAQYSEQYTFYTLADDGIRLWVNGVKLIDNWVNQGATEKTGSISLVAGQKYDIVIEYYENAGEAVAKLSWSGASTPKTIIPKSQLFPSGNITAPVPACVTGISPANGAIVPGQTTATLNWQAASGATSYDVYLAQGSGVPATLAGTVNESTYTATGLSSATGYSWYVIPKNASGSAAGCAANTVIFTTAAATSPIVGAGNGLQAVYFNNATLTNPSVLTRTDATINNDFVYVSPAPGVVNLENYSVRWTGQVQAQYSEAYTFYANTDDGVRLWVDGVQLIDNWVNQGVTEKSGTIFLLAGVRYNITLEYYQGTGYAVSKLLWSGASTPKTIIPSTQLYISSVPSLYLACAGSRLPANNSTIESQTSATLGWSYTITELPKFGPVFDLYLWSGSTAPLSPTISDIYLPSYNEQDMYVKQNVVINVPGLKPGTKYNWYVIPKNTSGVPALNCINVFNFTTADAAPINTLPGTGLQGIYYSGNTLSGTPLLTRIDPAINFDLTWMSPAPGVVPQDNYSVRWTGQVKAVYSETYTFYTNSDDGIRLWVNGVQLVNNWVNQGATEKSGSITLVAGQKYDIVIEYYEAAGDALTKLSWSGASTPKAIIPASQLYPPVAGARVMDAVSFNLQNASAGNQQLLSATPDIIASLAPNPVRPGQPARLQISSNKTGSVTMNKISSNGSFIAAKKINLVAGVNTTMVNTNGLAAGFYIINITGGSKPINMKLLIE